MRFELKSSTGAAALGFLLIVGSLALAPIPCLAESSKDLPVAVEEKSPSVPDHIMAFSLLRSEYYLPYNLSNYRVCLDCHGESMTSEKVNVKTKFRNGNTNMHFFHVNAEKGRNCKACHRVGDETRIVFAKEIPFGKAWMLPVKVTLTETGGSCNVGCHKTKKYDRNNPVDY